MSAVPQPRPPQVGLLGIAPHQGELLTPDALALLADLHQRFDARRQALLSARAERQRRFDAGGLPGFRPDTAAIRAGHWRVAPVPAALRDRRVEITGPTDPKTVINALNSGAQCFMADFEDSTAPTWANLVAGQRALREAVAGTLAFTSDAGKRYALQPEADRAVLIVRPRGWHLDEKHVLVDTCPERSRRGARLSASLFDCALFGLHNAAALAARDRGPYFYLPKLQSMEEAALWEDVLSHLEAETGLPHGAMKVTVLIETLPAAFEMDEILHALRARCVGLNCGRWDYIFACIKTLRAHRDRVLPERGQVTMTQPFLRTYAQLLVRTCHRRGAHAMSGMAAQIPINGDAQANEAALARVRADKLREVTAGHDGTWVAHPALIPIAREVFDAHMPQANQYDAETKASAILSGEADAEARAALHPQSDAAANPSHARLDAAAPGSTEEAELAQALLRTPRGTITRAGFENNVEVCVRYLAAWLSGNGCVPIHHLMEDAATAEIARAQLWRWLHHADAAPRAGDPSRETRTPLALDDGTAIDGVLFDCALLNLPSKLAGQALPGAERISDAIALLDQLTQSATLEEFLTLPAYELL